MNTLLVMTSICIILIFLTWIPLIIFSIITLLQIKKTLFEGESLFKRINRAIETTSDVSKVISELGLKAQPLIVKSLIAYVILSLLLKKLKK